MGKFGEYFPGTGDVKDMGAGPGKNYSINFPLKDGIDDEMYRSIYQPVMRKVMEVYQPQAIVLQCGSDSLSGDRLGCFNLSIKGHGECVKFMKDYNLPLLVLGGGGYTIRNVARCWTYETALLLDQELDNDLPQNEYSGYFAPNFNLHITPSNMENVNNPKDVENNKIKIFEALRELDHAPSAQIGTEIPEDVPEESDDEDEQDPDAPKAERAARHGDSDDEGEDITNKAKPAEGEDSAVAKREPTTEDAAPAATDTDNPTDMDVEDPVKEEAV